MCNNCILNRYACSTYHYRVTSTLQNRRNFHLNRGVVCNNNNNWRKRLLDFSSHKLSAKREINVYKCCTCYKENNHDSACSVITFGFFSRSCFGNNSNGRWDLIYRGLGIFIIFSTESPRSLNQSSNFPLTMITEPLLKEEIWRIKIMIKIMQFLFELYKISLNQIDLLERRTPL